MLGGNDEFFWLFGGFILMCYLVPVGEEINRRHNGDEGHTHNEGNAVFLLPDHDAEGHEDKCDGQVLTIGPEGNFVFEVRYVLCAHSASGV